MKSHQQQTTKGNESGMFSSLKSMANDLLGTGNSSSHQHQPQPPKRSAPTSKSTTNTNTTTTTTSTSKTQSLFPSYQTLQTALPQEVERVSAVLQNPSATLSQLEQGDRALDDLIVLLSSQLAQLAELKRDNSKKLINKLKSQQPPITTVHSPSASSSTPTIQTGQSPFSTTTTKLPSPVQYSVKQPTTQSENKGFGALANRTSSTKVSTPTTTNIPTKATPKVSNPLESMLDWQENDEHPVVVPTKESSPLFSMDDTMLDMNSVPQKTLDTSFPTDSILLPDAGMPSADDILGFESNSSNQQKEGGFLDDFIGDEKKSSNNGVMIDFSEEGQKIYQSNQILSMFDKPVETSILDTEDVVVPVSTTTVSSVDEFDF